MSKNKEAVCRADREFLNVGGELKYDYPSSAAGYSLKVERHGEGRAPYEYCTFWVRGCSRDHVTLHLSLEGEDYKASVGKLETLARLTRQAISDLADVKETYDRWEAEREKAKQEEEPDDALVGGEGRE